MIRKISILSIFVIAVVLSVSTAVFAQTAPISGKILLKKADGTMAPIEGVQVEVFRTDIRGAGPATKTDKKGQYSFAGLQLGGTFILSVSGPGIAPTYLPGVKPGSDKVDFTVTEGDGRRLTPDEVRELASQTAPQGGKAEMTEEQKKAQAEYDAKVKEVTAKNEKIVKENQIIEAALKDGNAAFTAKNFDIAVAKYDEGINANPTYAGSAPVLMNNKGAALRLRAIDTFNQNVRSTDASVKVAAFVKVKADLGEAADTYNKSLTILRNAPATEISDPKVKEQQMATALSGLFETFRLMALTEQVDETKLEIAKTAIPEYIAAEPDAAKKDQAKLILGDLYRVTGDADNAIAEYRKALEASPESLDAMAGLGLSLVNAGYINDNKDLLQEGANFLQKYATAAPDNHKYKADALGLIESLKSQQKIQPQKVSTPARRRNN